MVLRTANRLNILDRSEQSAFALKLFNFQTNKYLTIKNIFLKEKLKQNLLSLIKLFRLTGIMMFQFYYFVSSPRRRIYRTRHNRVLISSGSRITNNIEAPDAIFCFTSYMCVRVLSSKRNESRSIFRNQTKHGLVLLICAFSARIKEIKK